MFVGDTNMKIVLALTALCLGAVLSTPVTDGKHYKTVDHAFLEKQHKILTLFKHVHQHSLVEEHVQLYKMVNNPIQWLQMHKTSFEKPELVDTMIEFFHNDFMLPKGHIFSVLYEEHVAQAIVLFKLFYYAKDFQTFYETAVVMHEFVNEGLFLYATSVAVTHRKDCYGIVLPAIYEVYPWYFFNADVIHEAYKQKMVHGVDHKDELNNHHHVYANYSGHYLNLHWEQSLSYFTEDVGLNAFYHQLNLFYPYWMDGEEFHIKNDHRGALYLDVIHTLTARYYLERLSHGEGEILNFDWEVPFETPYYPSLQYPSGMPFPERPKFADLHDSVHHHGEHVHMEYANPLKRILDFERRLVDTIDSNLVYDVKQGKGVELYTHEHHKKSVDMFGSLLQCNADSVHPKYLKNYTMNAGHVLGYSHLPLDWKHVAPAALEHYETTLRDPAVYQLMKKQLGFYHHFQDVNMLPYHKNELVFPGVSIEKVEMDRLITYFDHFYSDISNVVYDTDEELKTDTFQVWAVQKRLNHKPFTYKIHVNSNQDTEAMVKVFIGPKYDEFGRYINMTQNRWNFVPIDSFQWHLKAGQNIIKHSSQENEFYAHDKTSFHELLKKVDGAYKGQGEFHVTGKENFFYFPDRLMLPIGSYNGVTYQFYFMVHPYKPYTGEKAEMTYFYPQPGTGGGYVDDYPTFYPFDKPIKYDKMFTTEVPNSYLYETKIYHRTLDEAQVGTTLHQH